ncbi:MAG: hypothetical protein Q8M74_05145 [Chloroflexota bacterium]|nr:hypothetical protein [Chloroflexota bacterium]
MEPHDVAFFASPAELRAWLEANHGSATELRVGYRLKASGLRRRGAARGAHGQAGGREDPVRA